MVSTMLRMKGYLTLLYAVQNKEKKIMETMHLHSIAYSFR